MRMYDGGEIKHFKTMTRLEKTKTQTDIIHAEVGK